MKLKRITALLLAFVITAAYMPRGSFADASVISVSTADELMDFLAKCTADEYSRDKIFVIEKDIDMEGREIHGGEIFCGILRGEGHTIKNAKMTLKATDGGLFTRVHKDAEIRDLNFQAEIVQENDRDDDGISTDKIVGDIVKNAGISGISPTETAGVTGGITAVNEGLIVDCVFDGTIKGKRSTGGIAGRNDDSGIIDTCAAGGEISGLEQTGGIAGENTGRVRHSTNYARVNPDAEEITRDTGGIAGYSSGVLENCVNNGAAGYEGYGTNTGGIAGRQNGVITECQNKGEVGGKKNVGGVCGLFVPFTDVDVTRDNIKQEIEDDKQYIKDEVQDLKDTIKDDYEEFKDEVHDFWHGDGDGDGGFDGVLDSLSDYINRAADRQDNSTDSTERIKDSLNDVLNSVRDSIDDDSGLGDSVSDSLSSITDSLGGLTDSLRDAIDSNTGDSSLSDTLIDTLKNLDANLNDITASMTDAIDSINDTDEDANKLSDSLSDFLDGASEDSSLVSNALADMLYDIDLNSDALDDISYSIRRVTDALEDVIDNVDDGASDIERALREPIRRLNNILKSMESDIEERKEKLASIQSGLEKIKTDVENWAGTLSFPTLKPIPTVKPRETQQPETIGKAIGEWLFPAALAKNDDDDDDDDKLLLDEILDTDRIKEELKKTVSVDVSLDRSVAGEYADDALIEYCINTGSVRGTENVGGTAGNMGVESLLQKGDTLELPNGKTVVSDMAVKAVISGCINDGDIYAKSKYAGGIVGSSNLGIIKGCLGAGQVEAEEDGCAGGIGGSIISSVLFSAGAAEVLGKSDLGGIAGKGDIIRECYSIATLDGGARRTGMIAASADGDVKNNCFIDEGVGGIGGTSYERNAQAIPFEEMKCTDKLPEKMDMFFNEDWVSEEDCFPQIKALAKNEAKYIDTELRVLSAKYARTVFTVTFIEEEATVKTLTKNYNETLSEEEIPALIGSEGRYPHWNRDTSAPIRRHTKFVAEYDDAVMTIASSEEPPILLAEGNFSGNTTIAVHAAEVTADFNGYEKLRAYSFSISPAKDAAHGFTLHILDKELEADAIGIVKDGKPHVVDCKRDGSYLVCELESAGEFAVLKRTAEIPVMIMAICAGAAAVSAAALILIRRKKPKKKEETRSN